MKGSHSRYTLALDFGGTKLAAALVNITTGEIHTSKRQSTDASLGAEASLLNMVQAGQNVLDESRVSSSSVEGIGISFGGPISNNRRLVLRSLHVPEWDHFALPDHISQIFDLPAFMDNDGNAAALGEWHFGAGIGCENMLYIQVSTGVGSGLILGGRLYRGGGLAGEFGHITVMTDGPECPCGKRGCLESLTAGWALARDGREAYASSASGSSLNRLVGMDPQAIDAKLVIEACRQGDPLATAIIERSFKFLGIGVSNAIMLLDPQLVVLGGGISRAWDILYPMLKTSLDEYLSPVFRTRVTLVKSHLNGTETLLGAALLTQEI
jgi:glucokinase